MPRRRKDADSAEPAPRKPIPIANCECGRPATLCSDWLSARRAMEIYDTSETTIRCTLPRLGVRTVNVPGLGWRIYRPDIDELLWDCLSPLTVRMHEERHVLRAAPPRKRRGAGSTA